MSTNNPKHVRTAEIRLSGYDPNVAGTVAPDGQLEPGAYLISEGIGAHAVITPHTLATLTDRDTVAVCRHNGNYILWREGMLYMLPVDAPDSAAMTSIGPASKPECATASGDMLWLRHDGHLHGYLYSGRGYDHLEFPAPLPPIEFGLVKTGHLSASPRIAIPAALLAAADTDTDSGGMSGTHQSTVNTDLPASSASDAIGSAIAAQYEQALDAEVYARGLWAQPFMVRYALRAHGGSYIAVSPPVMMLPNVLPPCITVAETVTDDAGSTASARLDMSQNPVCRLMWRALAPLSQEWHNVAAAIDIFVSLPVPTHSAPGSAFCAFGDLVSGCDTGASNRGRNHTASSVVFRGHYSEDGLNYSDFAADTTLLHSTVWGIQPNPRLCSELVAAAGMYRVASIPVGDICRMASFLPVPVENSGPKALADLRQLKPGEGDSLIPAPAALYAIDGRVIAAGGEYFDPEPYTLRQMSSFAGDATASSAANVYVEVYKRYGDELTATGSSGPSYPVDLPDAFPRFVYHPDPDAYMMQLSFDDCVYELPLTPHDTLGGSYWFGGLDADYTPTPAAQPTVLQSPLMLDAPHRFGNRIYVSSNSGIPMFERHRCHTVGHGDIISLQSAVVAPGEGMFGRFPVYAFASDGIRMLEYSSADADIVSAVGISDLSPSNASAIVPAGNGVAFIADRRLWLVKGSRVSTFASPASVFDITTLPGIDHLLLTAPVSDIDISPSFPVYFAGLGAVGVCNGGSSLMQLYSIDSRQMATVDIGCAASHAVGLCRGVLQSHDGRLLTLKEAPGRALLVTRPLKLGSLSPKTMHGISVWDAGICTGCGVALYGANHPDRWWLIGSSRTHRLDVSAMARAGMFRVVIAANLDPALPLHTIQISFSS